MDCLLAHGADPNIGDPSGNRPLHELAVHVDSLRLGETHEWVHKLLEHGADPRLRNKYGDTAGDLHMKCHHSIFGEELEETDDLKDALDAHCERLSLAERLPPAQAQNTPRRRARL
jgi:ankyrin repeat protein